MTILISGEIEVAPDVRGRALAEARPLIEAALAEPGCRHYAWSESPHDAGRIHVFEEWDSAAELEAHFVGEPYRGMLAHLGACGILAATTRKYRCDVVEPVYGADGKPTAGFGM